MRTTSRATAVRHRGAAAVAALSLAGALALTGCGADGKTVGASSADKAAVGAPEDAARGKPGAGAAAPPAAAGTAAAGTDAAKNGQQPAAVRPHVIRTATLALETPDVQRALAAARTAAEGAGGYVGNESTRREDGRMTSTLTLRVPGDRFDAVLGAMEGNGKLRSRKVEAQDVTEKVADVDSRVKSQQASVARVRDMMDRATALADVVMLESELSKRQSDLESLLAQQTALKDQTSMGTITMEVSEPAPEPVGKEKEDGAPSFTAALGGGWNVFTTIVRYLTLVIAALLPFAVTAALVLLCLRLYRRLRPAKATGGPSPKGGSSPREGPSQEGPSQEGPSQEGPSPKQVPAAPAVPAARPVGPTETGHLPD
ncbi:DUF4349 domain-containing protein [Streptomyces sp. NPDC056387]|uniref:DUF4349 domain-containing protein n=1 Tax=Streptomyces sp. NPDC056387 TaxID=3345803 RepID=UPI0035E11C58